MKYKKIFLGILFLVLFQIPLMIPFFHKGIFTSHDNVQVVRIFEMFQSIEYGGFPSYWSSGLLYGHGYPLFSFYSPLVYVIGALFVFLGANYLIATKLVFILGFIIGPIGCYFLGRKLFRSDMAAVVTAFAYSLAPYRAVDVYVRGALAEYFAFSIMPWVLWINLEYWENKTNNKKIKILFLFSLFLTLMILTHNLSALILLFLLGPLNIYYAVKNKAEAVSGLVSIFLSGVFALTLSCFYWLPILIEKPLVKLGSFSSYPYSLHFQSLEQLWNSPWGFLGSNKVGGMSLMLGKGLSIVSVAAFIINNLVKTKRKGLLNTLFAIGLILIFFETKYASFIWEKVPFFPYLQFPWRFHTIISLILCILTGAFIFLIKDKSKSIFWGSCVLIMAVLAWENVPHFRAAGYSDGPIASETTTWDDEYMPIWVAEKPKNYAPDKVWFASGSGAIKNIEWGYLKKNFVIEAENRSKVRIAQVYYPGWKAYINEEGAEIFYDNKQGLMTVDVPKGANRVSIVFQQVWYRQMSLFVSGGSLILGISLVLWEKYRYEKNS